ncbi:hypothetical protein KI387_042433, partial [Taxus chinensis]
SRSCHAHTTLLVPSALSPPCRGGLLPSSTSHRGSCLQPVCSSLGHPCSN